VKRVLGLDIGGANLKMAHTDGTARTVPFELWKQPRKLPRALRMLMRSAPAADELAITMTGELCDCYATRREGVQAILDAAASVSRRIPKHVWSTAGRFLNLRDAHERHLRVASANWLALATFVGRFARQGPAMLIDIGSTTCDLIPLLDGVPQPRGRTDIDRLQTGELAYKGARRTPICGIYAGGRLAMEVFATIYDAYIVLEWVREAPDDTGTADGRPATKPHAHARLARMLGGDVETVSLRRVKGLAVYAVQNHSGSIMYSLLEAASILPAKPRIAVLAGSGEFLGRDVLRWIATMPEGGLRSARPPHWAIGPIRPRIISLERKLGAELSTAACAYAVAVLAAEGAHGP
jgi:probable H4MPT-linked C1 transfer pathway protein